MKTKSRSTIVTLAAVAVLTATVGADRVAQWKQVEDSERQGRPKTAIEQLDPIIKAALEDRAYGEAVKAIAKKIKLDGDIQGRKAEEKISRLHAEADKAPEEIKPILEAILGHWYWHFFQQNRWRFMQRTQTGQASGQDILSWDLPRILKEIDKHFSGALAKADMLRKIPIAEYDTLLAKGNSPDSYRPTLYDFLANQALEFYAAGEQAAAKAQDAFELPAESPAFDPVDEFLKWKIETTDEDSVAVKALRLYQDLLRFHRGDTDPSALIDADLHRLQFAYNTAFGEKKAERYKAALKKLVDDWADHPISALAMHAWAMVLHGEGDLVEAHRLASRGAKAFANTPGGNRCHNLVCQIEDKSVQISTERVWNAPWPEIRVRYRNLSKVYYRIVQYDWESLLQRGQTWNMEYFSGVQRADLLNRPTVKEWSVDLPATADYQEREEVMPVPKDLAPGFHFVIASHDPRFEENNNLVSYAGFWVSDLALVVRTSWGSGQLEGFVLNAISGEPLDGAKIRSWYRTGNNSFAGGPSAQTDGNGLFQMKIDNGQSHVLLAEHKGLKISSGDYSDRAQDLRPKPYTRTTFFTDRALYRPGQTIQYKGICYRVDTEQDNYAVLPGQAVTVIFSDPNNKEVARQKHTANDYGSFSGSLTAPRDRLMGQMHLRVDGEPSGYAYFNVEEYKRPKFKVTLDAPKVAAKLDGEVKLQGRAMGYTGAAVDGANVRFRVVREVRYPDWWYWRWWWYPPNRGESQEIKHGTARTESDGAFTIVFTATPDRSASEDDEPTFRYTVYADVTDTAGETRSGQREVNVGYTALRASLSAADWQEKSKPVEITLSTRTLDGEGQQAEGMLRIHRLKEPEKAQRTPASGNIPYRTDRTYRTDRKGKPGPQPPSDLSNPNSWELAEAVTNIAAETGAQGTATFSVPLAPGLYRAVLETQDRFKKKVTAILPIQVLDVQAKKCALKIPHVMAAPKWLLEPGDTFMALWGSGYDKALAFVEIEHRGKMLRQYWTAADKTQEVVEHAVKEDMRGGFTLHVTTVRENRAYLESRKVNVPWSNKQLQVKWEHFTSKLDPAQKETWTAVVSGTDAKKAVAEIVAGLYDESLDAFKPNQWMSAFGVFRYDGTRRNSRFENTVRYFTALQGGWPWTSKDETVSYRSFPADVTANFYWARHMMNGARGRALSDGAPMKSAAKARAATATGGAVAAGLGANDDMDGDAAVDKKPQAANAAVARKRTGAGDGDGGGAEQTAGPDLSRVSARKNLEETAFFFPCLVSDAEGKVKMEFTMPEALTQWKFLCFAHDAQLRSGSLQDKAVTAKDIMVQPNPPRFLREGDALEFTVKVSNQSDATQKGTVRLTLADARTMKPADEALRNKTPDLPFEIPAKESRSFSWRLNVPDDQGFLQYKAVASTGKLSDGEEGYVPVLPRRILVTESLPLPIRKPETKKFEFKKLADSGKSDTLRHQSLVVQMVSQPAWYAVMALPYLMESTYDCSEQVFNRLYANSLARHIALSDPKIRRVFDLWKGTPALDSPLEKNQDLKSVMLEETPWFRQAQDESQARKNVGILFDDNRLQNETVGLQRKLAQMQLGSGLWPWFPGGEGSQYMTLYITTGFGRLRHLGVKDIDTAPAIKSLNALDSWIDSTYRWIVEHNEKNANNLTSTIALYLYGRSFFLKDKAVQPNHKEAVDYFLDQAKKYWLQLPRQSQGHLALGVLRFGQDKETPKNIMISLKEHSVTSEELGMFWRDEEYSWWWYRAPIETQAIMIEAFDEVAQDAVAVEECKVWTLKQKQTQDWKTTKATADAVYALLLRGTNLLSSDALVEVALAGSPIKPEKVEAGTGFYEKRFVGPEIKPAMGQVSVKKVDSGVSWGSVHWQYFEDMSKVTPHEGTPLKLKKALFTKESTKKGPALTPVKGAVKVGDELVARIELRVDRDMEYVHLKDQRGSGTEPVNVLSQYKHQDGLRYYESTRDTASHFFIDYLPKGTYVFEYSVRVQHKGDYQSGIAEIQCMYAPEFNSHSESFALKVE